MFNPLDRPTSLHPMEPTIIPRKDHPISRKDIHPHALTVLYRLHRYGYKSMLVGGALRDLLMGKKPKDFDVVTDARPGEIKEIFSNAYIIGRRFRIVHIRFRDYIVEVSTFRREPGPPPPHLSLKEKERWANNVYGTIEEDVVRRDFTINALYYNIQNFALYDFVGSLKDIRERVLRTLRPPEESFMEDPVRMVRALDYAGRLDLTMDKELSEGLVIYRNALEKASRDRLYEEFLEFFRHGYARKCVPNLYSWQFMDLLAPQLLPLKQAFPRLNQLLTLLDRQQYPRKFPKDFWIHLSLYALLFFCRKEPFKPSKIMDFTEEIFSLNTPAFHVPSTFREPLQQILVLMAKMHAPPGRYSLRKIKRHPYAATALSSLFWLREIFPEWSHYLNSWKRTLSKSYRKRMRR